MRENLILYNVLNQEVIFQEYFCNLLTIDSFRELFINFIDSKTLLFKGKNIFYNQFDTEVILDEKKGRADLFLNINGEKYIFEIKNKEYTELTKNQPESYLDYLKKNSSKNIYNQHLLFLIPKKYKHKDEIITRWEKYNKKNKNIENWTKLDIEQQLFYWEDFIREIQKANLEKDNLEIKMFCDFCLYWFNLKPIIFTDNEVNLLNKEKSDMNILENTSLPNIMEKLEEMVINVSSRTSLKNEVNENGFWYSKTINNYVVSFGIDYSLWKNFNVPLNIIIQNHQNDYEEFDEPKIKNIVLKGFHYEETNRVAKQFAYLVKFNESIGTSNYESILESVINDIINYLER